ncbi:MAG TPA: HNH endonuclease [Pirellulales bacterium]|nr:HNH endonuclease [Pirellulales bacterium]
MTKRSTRSGTSPHNPPADVAEVREPSRAAPLVHICIGDPRLNHLEQLEQAAQSGQKEFDWWNINKRVRPGDMVIFYLTSPVSAFVATGVVERNVGENEVPDERRGEFFGSNCFWISKAAMLPHRVTLNEAKDQFLAEWSYLNHPVVTSIPNDRTSRDLVERFLRFLRTSAPPTQEAADLDDPPERVATMTYRILRDTELAREVKRMHGHECQICGETIEHPDGSRYAEAHHVRPLGRRHNGPDVVGNILCLCPNHHAMLDLGVISIVLSEIRRAEGHAIDPRFVEYHNEQIHRTRQSD